jgi:hypothetical protein
MIAALLLRYGIPSWAAKLAGIAALVLGLWAALAWHDHRVFEQGVAQEKARRDVLDAANNAQAEAERLRLDRLVAQAQAQLDAARTRVDQLQAEVDHEKTISTDRQQRLLAGTERERPPLEPWIRAALSQQISMDELQAILSGCGRPATPPSTDCKPALSVTTP